MSGRCSTTTATTSRRRVRRRPVLVLGLTNVPGAGDNFLVVDEDRTARQIAEKRAARERNAAFAKRTGVRFSLENLDEALKAG